MPWLISNIYFILVSFLSDFEGIITLFSFSFCNLQSMEIGFVGFCLNQFKEKQGYVS